MAAARPCRRSQCARIAHTRATMCLPQRGAAARPVAQCLLFARGGAVQDAPPRAVVVADWLVCWMLGLRTPRQGPTRANALAASAFREISTAPPSLLQTPCRWRERGGEGTWSTGFSPTVRRARGSGLPGSQTHRRGCWTASSPELRRHSCPHPPRATQCTRSWPPAQATGKC